MVRVQLLGRAHLQLREVEVFNQMATNVAWNQIATQSSTYGTNAASKAVDGDKSIALEYSTSITQIEQSKYHTACNILMHISLYGLNIISCFLAQAPGGK